MVTRFSKIGFFRRDDGISTVEALITFPLLLIAIAVFVEFGFAVFQWNQTVKAVQLGARLAAVSNPLPTDMSALTADYPATQGGPTPTTPVTVSCGAGATACTASEIQRLVRGSDGTCNANFGTSLPGMCDYNANIGVNNVIISYHRSGLGYVGRPSGPVVTVTVGVSGLSFNLPILGRLLGLSTITIPSHPVSVTGEDLSSCQYTCP